jgi:hypothetical protein
MFQRPSFDPGAAAGRGPRARDGGYTFACLQQWFHLLAQRAAVIQFSCQSIGLACATAASIGSIAIAKRVRFMSHPKQVAR